MPASPCAAASAPKSSVRTTRCACRACTLATARTMGRKLRDPLTTTPDDCVGNSRQGMGAIAIQNVFACSSEFLCWPAKLQRMPAVAGVRASGLPVSRIITLLSRTVCHQQICQLLFPSRISDHAFLEGEAVSAAARHQRST